MYHTSDEMRYLVTGGAGFIGSNLVKRLLRENDVEVVVLDNLSTGRIENIQSFLNDDRFSFIQDSIMNYVILEKLIKSCDIVYHLASSVGVKFILNHKLKSLDTIILGTRNVFELCAIYGKRVLYASSSEVYGKSEKEIYSEEDDKLIGPSNIFRWSYSVGKTVGEYYATAFEEKGLNYDIVRFFNIVGANQLSNYGMVIPTFVKQAIRNEDITIHGDGEQIRCFTYVNDVVELCYRLSHTEKASNQYFNAGVNEKTSINELADLVLRVSGSKSQKKYIPYKDTYGSNFEDCRRRIPDNKRLLERIGPMEFTSLEDIIREIIECEIIEKSNIITKKDDSLLSKLERRDCRIAIVGLGYVGLPLAISLAKHFSVIGFDIDTYKIEQCRKGIDITNEVDSYDMEYTTLEFTTDSHRLADASFFVITVPTAVDHLHQPDLGPLISATEFVGNNLKRGSIIVYESTVYPGVTEDICLKILEERSGLKEGEDFNIGYSPERINCGDRIHTVESITKIVSARDEAALVTISKIYGAINKVGIFRASSIKVAEAAKVIENSQRDVNIAFINEMSRLMEYMGLNIYEIIEAMNTKWNALGFTPGLVGGHCIGVDSYYLLHKLHQIGIEAPVLQISRQENEEMIRYVSNLIVAEVQTNNRKLDECNVGILGITFKDNCMDIRNSKIVDLYKYLSSVGMHVSIYDECANKDTVKDMYQINLCDLNELHNIDVLVFAVTNQVEGRFSIGDLENMFRTKEGKDKIIVDLKGIYVKNKEFQKRFRYKVI